MSDQRAAWNGLWRVCMLTVGLCMPGCGESKQDVIDRYRAPYAQVRRQLTDLAGQVPPVGKQAMPAAVEQIAPPVTYDERQKTGNLEFLMFEQLADPDATPEFDLMLSRDLLRCLAWTGPKNPLSESVRGDAAGNMEEEFRRALHCEYLAVVRVVNYVPPQVLEEGKFVGGDVRLDVFLFRGFAGPPVVAFTLDAKAADSVQVMHKKSESLEARTADFVRSSVWQAARRKIGERLQQATGGDVRID